MAKTGRVFLGRVESDSLIDLCSLKTCTAKIVKAVCFLQAGVYHAISKNAVGEPYH